MNYSLFTDDIIDAFDGKVSVISYKDLANYKTIEDVLKPYGRTVILFEFKKNSGHWTCIFYVKKHGKIDHIEYFDSYGLTIGEPIKWVPYAFKKVSNQYQYIILGLLEKSKYPVYFNQYKLQSHGDNIATCGRHCIVRMLNNNMDENEYYKEIKKESKKNNMSIDRYVTELTKTIHG